VIPSLSTSFIWDFDGTLADTRLHNYRILRRLLADAAGALDRFPALASPETYDRMQRRHVNWRDVYTREFGFSDAETDRLGSLWSEYQHTEPTPATVFAGLGEVLRALSGAAHGVVSQNARSQILRTLEHAGLAALFGAVLGYDSVHLARQKPAPDGFLACLAALSPHPPRRIVGVGDHETDVRSARNAARALAERGVDCECVTIAVCFVDGVDPAAWTEQPDHVARTPADILRIAREQGLEA
jgi:HAD superfamily hydrolase (TIGR01549 family)